MDNKYSIIGIDLGTTNTCVASVKNDRPDILVNDEGNRITPSVVAFTDTGMQIGNSAVDIAHLFPKTTIFEVKRIIGRKFFDEQVTQYKDTWPTELFNSHSQPKFRIETKSDNVKEYLPEEISALILAQVKKYAEDALGHPVSQAVITVPAYFNDAQRQATKDAGAIAGLKVVRVLNEPTAAAIAYCFENKSDVQRKILVYDFGGGTFDVSILKVDGNDYDVLATDGNSNLGGSDIDMNIVNYLKNQFKKEYGKEITESFDLRRFKAKCEYAKKQLSSRKEVLIELDAMGGDHQDFTHKLSRAKFEDIISQLFNETIEIIDRCLKKSNLQKNEIDEIVLIGGSSRIPKVRELVQEYFDGKDLSKSINCDEAVALGAAIQGAILRGDKSETFQEIKIHDVTSLALGTSVQGGLMSVAIDQNTKIPTVATKKYYTVRDKQVVMDFPIYQGNRPNVEDNHELCEFSISGLTQAPPGAVCVEATFKIDENGILSVTAKETLTGKSKEITVDVRKSGLNDSQITQKMEEAKKYLEADQEIKRIIEAKNDLEAYCFRQKAIVNNRKELPGEKRKLVKETCDEAIRWLDGLSPGTMDEIQKKFDGIKIICDPIVN